jgi:hypothetical protein
MPSNRLLIACPLPLLHAACCLQVEALEHDKHVVTAAFEQVVRGMHVDLVEVKGRLDGLRGERDRWVGTRQACAAKVPATYCACGCSNTVVWLRNGWPVVYQPFAIVALLVQAGGPAGRGAAAAGGGRG